MSNIFLKKFISKNFFSIKILKKVFNFLIFFLQFKLIFKIAILPAEDAMQTQYLTWQTAHLAVLYHNWQAQESLMEHAVFVKNY